MRSSTKWQLPLLAGAALALGAGVGGGTFALWNGAPVPVDGATISSGDLDVEASPVTWHETSADVAGAPHAIDPTSFLARQGDTLSATYPFTIALDGENLRARVDVSWAEAPNLPAGATAAYTLVDGAGHDISNPIPLGTGTDALGTLDLTAAVSPSDFALRVDVDLSGLSDRLGATSAAQIADFGDFTVTLQQIRTGGGFE